MPAHLTNLNKSPVFKSLNESTLRPYSTDPPATLGSLKRSVSRGISVAERDGAHRSNPWGAESGEQNVAWNNDDAVLHFDPHLEFDVGPVEEERTQSLVPPLRLEGVNAGRNTAGATSRKVGRDVARPSDEKHLDSNDMEAELKEKILADHALYLRILRYEVCRVT